MNKNSILIICILSILSLSVFVEGEEIEIKFDVCSFRPEELPPTAKPITPKPVETYPTIADVETTSPTRELPTGDGDDETGETTQPSATKEPETTTTPNVEVTTTASSENGGSSDGGDTEETKATSSEATTPAVEETTTTPKVTPTPSEGTEDDTPPDEKEGGKADNRGMDDDEEKLVLHKRLLSGDEDGKWPNKIDENKMKEYIETAFKAYVDTTKSTGITYSEPLYSNSEQSKGKVQYNVTIKVTYNTENKVYWEGINDEITSKNADQFYESIEGSTGKDYTKCSLPEHFKDPTPCSYGKSLYSYTKGQTANLEINPVENTNLPTNYTVDCTNKEYLSYNNEKKDGKVKVNTTNPTSYSICSVTCIAANPGDEYRNGYTSFSVKVSDNTPSYNHIKSIYPTSVTYGKRFSVTAKLDFPTDASRDGYKAKITFTKDKPEYECDFVNNEKEVTLDKSSTSFKFDNLEINCNRTSDGKLPKVKMTITSSTDKIIDSIEKAKKTVSAIPQVRVDNYLDPNKPKTDNIDLNNADKVQYMCDGNKNADVNGLCCNREGDDYTFGASCTKSTVKLPFEGTESMTEEERKKFVKSYLDGLTMYVFNYTNFKYVEVKYGKEIGNKLIIEIDIKFYENKIWLYSYLGEEKEERSKLVRRSLQSTDVNWKSLSSPYVYINTIISYVNPAAVPEIESSDGETQKETKVLESIPEELKEFVENNNDLKQKLVTAAENVQKEITETTGKVVAEINKQRTENGGEVIPDLSVSFDAEEGITTEEVVPDNVSPPTNVLVISTKAPEAEKKPWAEEYWWVILIICVGGVLLIGIIIAIIVVSVSSSGSKSSGSSKKDIEKSEKIMETVIPIEKIKQENEISDDDIYKPFSYEVIMEGYLLKEGRDRVLGKWQRRYCVLYFDPAIMRIYDSMVPSYYGKVYLDEKQSIPLDCYNGIEYKDGSSEFTLVLKVRDSSIKSFEAGDKDRKIHLKVEGENSIETAKKWVECFRDFKNQKPKSGETWTRPLIIDESNGKITTSTSKAAEKKNEDIVMKAQQRRQAHAN